MDSDEKPICRGDDFLMDPITIGLIVLTVASAAYSYYAAQKAAGKNKITAGEVDINTAEAGREIMVVFGTRIIKSPNTAWFGDIRTEEIKK